MKYRIKISEIKKRSNFFSQEVNKYLQKFLLTFKQEQNLQHLLMFKFYKNKRTVRTSVSFIHNRCVISLRLVLCSVYLNYLVTISNKLVLMAELQAFQSLHGNYA